MGGPPGSAAAGEGTPFLWTVTTPANGAKETFKGVELSWQHFLDNGFGTHMQYTHTWSSSANSVVNEPPPTTFSISLIYDKGTVQRRL